ncbi:hypothetical protein RIF29_45437 [Crotalaria pallida]|uniref:Uncharacterized protein n=1 Tax=Crotalaria pallida TaxID=3830 RepID=A0AAN9DNN3_CROPI
MNARLADLAYGAKPERTSTPSSALIPSRGEGDYFAAEEKTTLRTTARKTSTDWNGPLTDIGIETSRGYASTRSNIKKEKEGIEPGRERLAKEHANWYICLCAALDDRFSSIFGGSVFIQTGPYLLLRDLGIPLPITQDPQATMAPPPPARVRDRSADLGTTYARADTRVYANSSEVLSDVPSIPLLVDLSAPATDDSIASSTLVPPAQEHPAPHSSSTSGSIHPMVTRSCECCRCRCAVCLVFPDESDADSACVAWCGSAYLLVGQGASRAMASDGILFFPLLGLSEDSHFQALALKLKQKMRLSQLHSLIEPSVARRKEGLCLHNKRMRVSKAKFLIQRGFGFDRLLETLLSKLSSSFAISEKALMGPRLSRCNCQVKDALKQDWNRRSRLRE